MQRSSECSPLTPLPHKIGFCFYREGENSQDLAYLGREVVAAHRYLFPGSTSFTFLGRRASLRDFDGGGQQTSVLRPGLAERALLTRVGSVATLSAGTLPTAMGGREGNHLRKGPGACRSKERRDAEGVSKDPSSPGRKM